MRQASEVFRSISGGWYVLLETHWERLFMLDLLSVSSDFMRLYSLQLSVSKPIDKLLLSYDSG